MRNVNNLLFTFSLIVLTLSCEKSKTEKMSELENNIKLLKNYRYKPNDNFNSIQISEKTANSIVDLINNENGDIKNIKTLELNSEIKNKVKIYSFGFDSGGTGGFISYPIIQWFNNKKTNAYNLSKIINFKFDKIIDLKNNLYLLIGYNSGSNYQSIAYVLEITESKINIEYKAFVNRPFLIFRKGEFIYNEKNKVLSFVLDKDAYGGLNDVFYSNEYGKFKNDTLSALKLKVKLNLLFL